MTTNHPAHGPVSLDRLHQISEILSKAAAQSDGGNLGYAMADAVKVIDGAIAAFGDEPDENGLLPCPFCGGGAEFDYDDDNLNWISCNVCGISTDTVYHTDVDARDKLRAVWNRRAAMLQGSQPVSNRDALPLDYLQGHKDGLEWAAQLAEANHPQTGDWLYDDPIELAKAIRKGPDMPDGDGNPPATPDGYVLVPKEMTPEMMRAVQIKSELGGYAASELSGAYDMFSEFWDVAVSAAPKQGVK
ncbi:Lar family restriction alleviation protein [Citrobacter freundii]|uniref:Lar family restriction alleviation protein n=1 Tax=Citrobacter freundii TaxID=546 RepID=UPI0018C4A0CE|nr:Lar family restriction alleviation protein [Citrobacter freundii]